MKIYTFKQIQNLPVSIDEAWNFFSNPKNLNDITPPSLNFEITSELPEKMYSGMVITYKIKIIAGIPQIWVTEIKNIEEKKFFIDEQRFGPYKFWHHKHIFKEIESGVEMTDLIHYAIPFGIFGQIANSIFVQKKLNEIFSYRKKYLSEKFK